MAKRRASIKSFIKALVLSTKIKTPFSFAISILGFGMAFFPMLIALQLEAFTNNAHDLFNQPNLLTTAIISFGILVVLFIAQIGFSFMQTYMAAHDNQRIKHYLREQILILLSRVPYKHIENQGEFREKIDFVKRYSGERTAGSVSLVFGWIANVIALGGVVFILWRVNPWIVSILMVTSIPAVILSMLQKEETYHAQRRWMKDGQFVIAYSDICMRTEPLKEIKFLGIYETLKNKWRHYGKRWMANKRKLARKHVLLNGAADILRNVAYVAVLIIAVIEIYANPEIRLGAFMLVFSSAVALQNITTQLLTTPASIFTDAKYMEDFFTLLDWEKETTPTDDSTYNNVLIEFNNVNFSYQNSDFLALDNLNVRIKQGEKIAIVGANGSGKSTFVNLLCGLHPPNSGEAKINGESITDNVWKARRSMSVIFQNFCQYQDTLRNNIAVSDPERAGADADILALAKQTGADEVIKNQESALDEVLGIFSKDGNNLSGGQWQKVAITRALFRKNARVYILDEPTAALDPIAEANIYRNFAALTGDKTTILISHRLGVTSVVDRILVFDNGRIVEDGKHDTLMRKNGLYAKMYNAQAKWYH